MKPKFVILAILILILVAGGYFFYSKNYSNQTNISTSISSQPNSSQLIEIFFLPHPPAQAIVDQVKTVLSKYPQFTVVEYDLTDTNNSAKIAEYNLVDHTPIAIFINGTNSFTIEGRNISLTNFPQGDAFVPTLEGTWNYSDLDKILAAK